MVNYICIHYTQLKKLILIVQGTHGSPVKNTWPRIAVSNPWTVDNIIILTFLTCIFKIILLYTKFLFIVIFNQY